MASASDTLFIVGSGFTKAVFPQAPLNADLLRAVVEHGGSTLGRCYKQYRTDDIERLLTQVDLDVIESLQNRDNRVKINGEISSYFSKFRFPELQQPPPSWLRTFALDVLKPNDAIITLNYDCFLEGALDNYKIWTPNGGYAGIVNPNADPSIPKNPKDILLYKIHGSENFVESSVVGENRAQTAIGFEINELIFPKSGANRHFGGGALYPRRYIIAPSFVKIPHVDIATMMLEALKRAEAAKNLAILGCGMRREDNFLWLLLTRFLNKTLVQRKHLIILGPDSNTTWEKISNYWVGSIKCFADVVVIPDRIESSIERLRSALGGVEGRINVAREARLMRLSTLSILIPLLSLLVAIAAFFKDSLMGPRIEYTVQELTEYPISNSALSLSVNRAGVDNFVELKYGVAVSVRSPGWKEASNVQTRVKAEGGSVIVQVHRDDSKLVEKLPDIDRQGSKEVFVTIPLMVPGEEVNLTFWYGIPGSGKAKPAIAAVLVRHSQGLAKLKSRGESVGNVLS